MTPIIAAKAMVRFVIIIEISPIDQIVKGVPQEYFIPKRKESWVH
jgi:hypothetical protein